MTSPWPESGQQQQEQVAGMLNGQVPNGLAALEQAAPCCGISSGPGRPFTAHYFAVHDARGHLNLPATCERMPDSEYAATLALQRMFTDAGHPVLCGKQTRGGRWLRWADGVYAQQEATFADDVIKWLAQAYRELLGDIEQWVKITAELTQHTDAKEREKYIAAQMAFFAGKARFRDRLWSEQGQAAMIRQLGRTCGEDEGNLDAGTGEIVLDADREGRGRISVAQILRDGRVEPLKHDPAIKVTKRMGAGVRYDPAATCPVFDEFLRTSVADGLQRFWLLWRTAHALFGDSPRKGFVNDIGEPDSGKSTFTAIIARLAGGYARSVDAKTFMAKHASDPGFLADELRGARFVSTHEPEPGSRFATGYVKSITGRADRQRTAAKYGQPVEWLPQCTVFIGTNRPIRFDTSDEAMMRRQEPIRFARGYAQPDPYLEARMATELPGILNRLLECLLWEARNGGPPELPASMLAERERLADETEDALRFVTEWLEKGWLAEDWTVSTSNCIGVNWLHEQFEAWCIGERIKQQHVPGRKTFSAIVGRRYPAQKSNGYRFRGLIAGAQPI
jgi:hypothetical protein